MTRGLTALLLVSFAGVASSAADADTSGKPPAASRQSPFMAPQTKAAAPVAAGGVHDFTGVIVTGKDVLVNLTNTQAKRSFWIPVGKSIEGIEVMSYDRKDETVAIRLGGETKRLALKQPSVAAISGGAIATIQVAPAVPLAPLPPLPPPSTPAEAEREARMLVSDLLEIGMQQRKAYEEAQKKASTEAAKKAMATPIVPTPKT